MEEAAAYFEVTIFSFFETESQELFLNNPHLSGTSKLQFWLKFYDLAQFYAPSIFFANIVFSLPCRHIRVHIASVSAVV